jgi:hypothetical protein
MTQQSKTSAKKTVHNKYDLTADPCFGLATHNHWSKWVAITSVPPISSLSLSFMDGVGLRKQKQNLDAAFFSKRILQHQVGGSYK